MGGGGGFHGNHNHFGNFGNFGAGLFGFALGAAVGSNMDRGYNDYYAGGWDAHVARCEARYRSYDPSTNMFLGNDGKYHNCSL